VWRWDQAEPFGNNPANDDPDGNSVAFDLPLRFPGQRYDAETALHYNFFRDYDPTIGRYEEPDLIGLAGGLNVYSYVIGDPIQYQDEFGLETGSLRERGYPPAGVEFCFLAGSLTGGGGEGYPHYFLCVNGNCGGFYPGLGGDLKGRGHGGVAVPGEVKNDSADYSRAVCRVVQTPCDQSKFIDCIDKRIKPGIRSASWRLLGRNCRVNADFDIADCRRLSCMRD
jgi:RHS repeat-associated protein